MAALRHLADESAALAAKLKHVLACMRSMAWDRGGQQAVVYTSRGPQGRERRHKTTAKSPFVAEIAGLGPSAKDVAFLRVTPAPTRAGNDHYYGETGAESGSQRMLVKCPHTLYPEEPADRVYLQALDRVCEAFSEADLSYIVQPPGQYVTPPGAKEAGFRRRVDISAQVAREDYVVHGHAAGPCNELISQAARLSGAPSASAYSVPGLHRTGLTPATLAERTEYLKVEDYKADAGSSFADVEPGLSVADERIGAGCSSAAAATSGESVAGQTRVDPVPAWNRRQQHTEHPQLGILCV